MLATKTHFFKSGSALGRIRKAYEASILQANISLVRPKYSYNNDVLMNPAYQNSESITCKLAANEKRIWVLREDFILATGVKNAYQKEFNYHGFDTTFQENFDWRLYVNGDERYGHPSLTLDDKDESLGVYYAGYVSQDTDNLTVFLASGRYERNDLSAYQTHLLESYIALLFQEAYGKQKVIFYHGMKPYKDYASDEKYVEHMSLFFNHQEDRKDISLYDEPQRTYIPNLFN